MQLTPLEIHLKRHIRAKLSDTILLFGWGLETPLKLFRTSRNCKDTIIKKKGTDENTKTYTKALSDNVTS